MVMDDTPHEQDICVLGQRIVLQEVPGDEPDTLLVLLQVQRRVVRPQPFGLVHNGWKIEQGKVQVGEAGRQRDGHRSDPRADV